MAQILTSSGAGFPLLFKKHRLPLFHPVFKVLSSTKIDFSPSVPFLINALFNKLLFSHSLSNAYLLSSLLAFWNLDAFVQQHMLWILAIGALIGIVPESGPHLIFVMMYAQGLVPFSVLFTTSFVQDGHGMLLMISYSLKDSVLIKVFTLIFGLAIGSILFAMGF